MKIYLYSPATKEFKGERKAIKSPLFNPEKHKPSEEFLVPANATTVKPPKIQIGEVALFDESSQKWSIKPDHRGKTCYKKVNAAPVEIKELGDIPSELTELKPDGPSVWGENSGAWLKDMDALWSDVRAERDLKIDSVRWECERNARENRLNVAPKRSDVWMIALDQYVQELCDVPQNQTDPENITWPTLPSL